MTTVVGTYDVATYFREMYREQWYYEVENWLHHRDICTWGEDNCHV